VAPLAAATLLELRASLQAKGYDKGFEAGSGTASNASLDQALNAANRQVVGLRRWRFRENRGTLTATVDQAFVLISPLTRVAHVDAVRINFGTDFYDLDFRTPQELRALEHVDRTSGRPEFYTVHAQEIRLYPIPDLAYTVSVDYVDYPAAMVADGDPSGVPIEYQDALVWYAARDIAHRQRDWSGAQAARDRYKEALVDMQREYAPRQRQTSNRVGQTGIWD